jgi:uncharacterized protein with PQ loop repeat
MIDSIGWVASAVFAASYLCKDQRTLRWVQAVAALLWMTYGILLNAKPVIVANAVVALMAVVSTFWRRPVVEAK